MKLRRAAALLAGIFLAACAAPGPPAFSPEASRDAGVSWRRGAETLAVQVAFQSGAAGSLRLVVVTPEAPLFTLTRQGGKWIAAGPLAGKGWRGAENAAPAALAGWLNLAEAYEAAAAVPEGDSDVRTGRFSVRYAKRGAELRGLELVSATTGDRFRVTFPDGR